MNASIATSTFGLNVSTLPYPNIPLHDVMRATAARHPDRRAITFKGATWSFAQFDLDSNRLANGLAALGLGFGDRMSLYLPNCPQYELGFYAARDRKSTRLNSSHIQKSRMPSSA